MGRCILSCCNKARCRTSVASRAAAVCRNQVALYSNQVPIWSGGPDKKKEKVTCATTVMQKKQSLNSWVKNAYRMLEGYTHNIFQCNNQFDDLTAGPISHPNSVEIMHLLI